MSNLFNNIHICLWWFDVIWCFMVIFKLLGAFCNIVWRSPANWGNKFWKLLHFPEWIQNQIAPPFLGAKFYLFAIFRLYQTTSELSSCSISFYSFLTLPLTRFLLKYHFLQGCFTCFEAIFVSFQPKSFEIISVFLILNCYYHFTVKTRFSVVLYSDPFY